MQTSKEEIRRRVWDELQRRGVARPPLPPHGRIPNFEGAERAAANLFGISEWQRAVIVKVNPDSPQRPVRRRALEEGKLLLMPTPRLRRGFLVLDPGRIPASKYWKASTIRGAFRWGKLLQSVGELVASVGSVDLIVEGSVAVDIYGGRLGKGEGYGELEYAILAELGLAGETTPIATTVHDIQVFEEKLPQDPWDVPLDVIATPTRILRVRERRRRPPGILWDRLPPRKLEEIPILREMAKRTRRL